MFKISNYLKALALLPSSEKSIRIRSNWRNELDISPKRMNDLSGLIVPRLTDGSTYVEPINLQYLQRMYDCHDLVSSCIEMVSSTFALGKLKVKQRQPDGKYKYVPDHPLQRVLDNPNSSMTGYDLRQSYVVHKLLFGTVAFILVRGEMLIDETEAQSCPACREDASIDTCWHLLWMFHKGRVTQILPVYLDVLEKKYFETPSGGKWFFMYSPDPHKPKMPIHPDNILTDPNYNPGVSFYGSSPTMRVQRWLEIDLGLSKQVGAYFANNAIPSMLLNLKPPQNGAEYDKDPSELLNMMKENWMKKFSLAGDGVRSGTEVKSPAFVYGDIQVQKIQDSLKDIVVKPLFFEIQNRIAMAYKVPRSLFEFGLDLAPTASKQQREDFFNDAISPQLLSFKSKIERYILPSFSDADTLQIIWDLSDMGVASFLLEKKQAFAMKKWEMGIVDLDEVREDLQLDPYHNSEEGQARYRTDVLGTGQPASSGNPTDNLFKPNPKLTMQAFGKPDTLTE